MFQKVEEYENDIVGALETVTKNKKKWEWGKKNPWTIWDSINVIGKNTHNL